MDDRLQRLFGRAAPLRRADALAAEGAVASVAQGIVTFVQQGVMVFATDGALVYWNPAAERILGRTLDARYRGDAAVTLNEDGSALPNDRTPLARALVSGQAVRNVVLGEIGSDGLLRWLEVCAEPIAPVDTLPAYVVVTLSDVTEPRRTQTRLRQARERLDAVTRLQGGGPGYVSLPAIGSTFSPNRADKVSVVSHEDRRAMPASGPASTAITSQANPLKEDISSQNASLEPSMAALLACLDSRDLAALDGFRVLESTLRRMLTHRQEGELRMALEVLAFERAGAILRDSLAGGGGPVS